MKTYPRKNRAPAGAIALLLFAASGGAALAQSLTVTTGLQLWLKADAGISLDGTSVVTWADQSESPDAPSQVAGAPALENAPQLVTSALNGRPVLRFDGVDDYLSMADTASTSITGDMTTFFVVRFADFATYRAVWTKTNGNLPAPTDYYTLPGSGIPQLYRGDGTFGQLASFASTTALTADTFQAVGFAMEDTACSHFIGGAVTSTGTINVTEADTDSPLLIGTRGDFVTRMKGDIAEIMIYDRSLSAAERASVVGYLGVKYGIANENPTVSLSVSPAGPHTAGDTVTLSAAAADTDGSIADVKFYVNGGLAGTATAPPWSMAVRLDTPSTYTFTARATDNRAAFADSAPVVRSAAGGAPPVLPSNTSLQLWLKADAGLTTSGGGAVLAWADQSGKGNDANSSDETTAPAVAAAAVNALPAVRFDGVDDAMQVADSPSVSITGDITSFSVVKMDDFATYRAVWGKTAGPSNNLPAPTDFYIMPSPNAGQPRIYRGDGAGAISNSLGTTALRAGQYEMVGFSAAGSAFSHFLNGSANGGGTMTTTTADADTPLWIGTRNDQFTRMKGDIAELLIYNSALSATDRRAVEVYLAGRYAMPFSTALNTAPTVTLTAPASGGSAVAPADITVSADAADADGSIVKVEFLVNGGLAATATTAPFSATVNIPVATVAVITARATDNLGAVTLSAARTFTTTAAEPNPLPALTNLKLWLRGDKGVTEISGGVSAWVDQSGNFNNPVQTIAGRRPIVVPDAVNGKTALRFDGADDSMIAAHSSSLAITGDISSFFVVKYDDYTGYNVAWAKTQSNQPGPTDFYTLPVSGRPQVFRGNGVGGAATPGVLAANAGEYAIVGFDHAGTTLRHYLNGDWNGDAQNTAARADTGRPLYIGTRDDQFTRMKGEIAEIIIYDSALSDADRAQVHNYLSQRYGITLVVNPAPALSITSDAGGNVSVAWPVNAIGWGLESSPDLLSPWTREPTLNNSAVLPASAASMYFRLHRQP